MKISDEIVREAGLLFESQAPKPGELFRKFKRELGLINVQLCVVDAALCEYGERVTTSAALAKSVQYNGHYRLNPSQLNMDRALDLGYLSMVALLLSRMDQLCRVVRNHSVLDQNLRNKQKGDYLRKTVRLVLECRHNANPTNPIDNATLESCIGTSQRTIFDKYLDMRNAELHALEGIIPVHADGTNVLDLRFRNILECSKALQSIAEKLCHSLSGPPLSLIPDMRIRFGEQLGERRRNATKCALEQDYLLDGREVEMVLHDMGW